MDDTIIITRASRCLSIMNIHGTRRAGRRGRNACRLWTGGRPQRAYSGRCGGILCRHAHSLLLLCDAILTTVTSCARGDTICLRPCKYTISLHLFARWHLFRHVGYLRHRQHVDLWPFDLESGARVTSDVGYLCANFSLPRHLCSRLRSDVRDRQTDVRRQTKVSLNASALWGSHSLIIVTDS